MLFNKLALALLAMITVAAALPTPSHLEVGGVEKRHQDTGSSGTTVDPSASGNHVEVDRRGCETGPSAE